MALPVFHQILISRGSLDKGFREIVSERLDALFKPLVVEGEALANQPVNANDYVRASGIIVQKLDEADPGWARSRISGIIYSAKFY